MRNIALTALSILLCLSTIADAQQRETLGWGRLLNNDVFGDGKDRWQTGGGVVSKVTGYGWEGVLPDRPGDIIEYRFWGGVIAPADLVTPAAGDRRYAASLSFGVHTYFQRRNTEFNLGADLVITGPQTGLGTLQRAVHQVVGEALPTVLATQIPNGFHPTLIAEAGRSFAISPNVAVRPFVEVQAGVETLVRVGGDVRIGRLGSDELMLRDVMTGHRYRGNRGEFTGWAAVFGADVARVEHSTYLPAASGYALTDARTRVRAGVHWQGKKSSVFYGVTYLGEEFVAQPEGQIVGSVRLNIKF